MKGRFESLCCFFGGITSVFPGTAQVESKFLIVKAEKDKLQPTLINISLEGVLHSNQLVMISSI